MRSEGIETLKAVARRSAWIVVLLVVAGVVAMNLLRHSEGPEYQATSRVVLSPTDLATTLAGFSGYVDPDVLDTTERALASSAQLFENAAARWGGALGDGDELKDATEVSKSPGTVSFTVTGSDPDKIVAIANAVATTYPRWRAGVSSAAIDDAIQQVEAQIATTKKPDPSLTDQLNRLRVLKTLTSGNVLLVERADGANKTRPNPVKDSLLGAFIGLFVALLIVAGREAIDTRVRSEAEVEELLNVPVIGTVESLPRRMTVVTGRRGERYRDMYALLATSLTQLNKDSKRMVIAVTSATAEEGKTTTASNVAAALAQRNANVVLVDLDSRKPSLSKVFKIPPGAPGIDDVIARNADPEDAMWTISLNGQGLSAEPAPRTHTVEVKPAGPRRVEAGSLRVLPMGPSVKEGVARHSRRLRTILSGLSRRADYVVVDTPPALSLPDMTEIAELVDVVLIVVRHGRVSRRTLAALTRVQRNWPDVNLAAVLVGTPRHEESYAYYGRA